MHPGGEGTRHQAARRRARPAAGQGPRARPVVSVGAEGIWRHGPRSAGQRAGADGARREHARRTVDEHTGPDDASMMTILAHGTEYQKEKFLKPLLNGDKRICFSMTEKAAGADATGMQTTAVKDGNENYILNGEKWFSSSASV